MYFLKIIFYICAVLLMPIIAQGNQIQMILNKSIIKNLQLSTFMRCSSGEVRIIPVNNNFNDYLLIIKIN